MQAWANKDGSLYHTVDIDKIGKNDIPLYNHPVKELTDEEILEICNQFEEAVMLPVNGDSEWSIPSGDYLYFARAILRKAQEK